MSFPTSTSRHPLIAVVDDEAAVRKSLSRFLGAAGFEVRAYASGKEFLDAWLLERPACVVLDLQMSGLTGIDVQARLGTSGDAPPVIMITANDDPDVRRTCIALGIEAFLLKPVNGEYLLQVITSLIERTDVEAAQSREA
jgi:FixJ family two-component response regulator